MLDPELAYRRITSGEGTVDGTTFELPDGS
jgi:hypothetical protein